MGEKEVTAGTSCCILDFENRAEMGSEVLHGLRKYFNVNKCKGILSGELSYPKNPDFVDNVPGALPGGEPVAPARPGPGAPLADRNR